MSKWDKAIINIQGEGRAMLRAESEALEDTLFKQLRANPLNNHLSDWDLKTEILRYIYQMKGVGTGTAIYLKDKGKYYLLTAAHVVIDRIATKDVRIREEQFKKFSPNAPRQPSVVYDGLKVLRRYGSPEFIKPGYRMYVLSIEGASPKHNSYSLSEELDLAVISLNMGPAPELWRQTLDSLGFVPISIKDLDINYKYEIGSAIMCVGFPEPSKISGPSEKLTSMGIIEGLVRSLPVFSFGKIALNHNELHNFWGDVSIYPGNSGGPVIHKNKIIGIVSAQSSVRVETLQGQPTELTSRIPFGNFIKISHIIKLLNEMQSRESTENYGY